MEADLGLLSGLLGLIPFVLSFIQWQNVPRDLIKILLTPYFPIQLLRICHATFAVGLF